MRMQGKFITIEGIEGVGKTTSIAALATYLEQQGLHVVCTREPGGTSVGEAIRELLLRRDLPAMQADTELMLMFAARVEHVQSVIRPALQAGHWVVCDRFTDATYAYQGAGRDISNHRIAILEDWVQAGLRPNLTLLLDCETELALTRAKSRNAGDRIEQETAGFFNNVRGEYLRRAAQDPARIHIIDASQAPAEVHAHIRNVVDKLYF